MEKKSLPEKDKNDTLTVMESTSPQIRKLRFQIRILKSVLLVSLAACLFLAFWVYRHSSGSFRAPEANKALPPHYQQITNIISPLHYSGLYSLIHPEVTIVPDFDKNLWRICNLHRFDADGRIILEENRYGLCGELSAFAYGKIKPLLDKNEILSFARVAESGFFLTPQATHTVLMITDNSGPAEKNYLIDPSFGRYADRTELDTYMIFDVHGTSPILEKRSRDVFYSVDQGAPVLIEDDNLISLAMEKSGGKFDKENFVIALLATQRYKYCGRYLLALRNNQGNAEIFENKALIQQILKPDEYKRLREKMLSWFEQLY